MVNVNGLTVSRSSHRRCSLTKSVLRNFVIFAGKKLCRSLFFNKVAGLRPSTLLKKRLWHRCFPVNFAKFLRSPFVKEYLWWLLLSVLNKPLCVVYYLKIFFVCPKSIFSEHYAKFLRVFLR